MIWLTFSEASQLLGVITASLNLDTNNGTKTDADNIKRQNVRIWQCQFKS